MRPKILRKLLLKLILSLNLDLIHLSIQSCYTIPDASLADPDTNERLGIIDRFLDAISGTIVYQETNQFLVNNGLLLKLFKR